MDSLYYYVGLVVVWACILAITSLIGWGIYKLYFKHIHKRDWWAFYIRRELLPTDLIRDFYHYCKSPHSKHYTHLFRLRNIKRVNKLKR